MNNRRLGVMFLALVALMMVFGACVAPVGAPAADTGGRGRRPGHCHLGLLGQPGREGVARTRGRGLHGRAS